MRLTGTAQNSHAARLRRCRPAGYARTGRHIPDGTGEHRTADLAQGRDRRPSRCATNVRECERTERRLARLRVGPARVAARTQMGPFCAWWADVPLAALSVRNLGSARTWEWPGIRRLYRIDHPAHDPGVLADLPDAGESALLEEFDGRAVQETALRRAAIGQLRGWPRRGHRPGLGHVVERAFQRRPCDAVAAMFGIDVQAGDAPVRMRGRVLVVLAFVLDAREFLGAAVLAPPLCGAVLVEDERGVSAPCPGPALSLTARWLIPFCSRSG